MDIESNKKRGGMSRTLALAMPSKASKEKASGRYAHSRQHGAGAQMLYAAEPKPTPGQPSNGKAAVLYRYTMYGTHLPAGQQACQAWQLEGLIR